MAMKAYHGRAFRIEQAESKILAVSGISRAGTNNLALVCVSLGNIIVEIESRISGPEEIILAELKITVLKDQLTVNLLFLRY